MSSASLLTSLESLPHVASALDALENARAGTYELSPSCRLDISEEGAFAVHSGDDYVLRSRNKTQARMHALGILMAEQQRKGVPEDGAAGTAGAEQPPPRNYRQSTLLRWASSTNPRAQDPTEGQETAQEASQAVWQGVWQEHARPGEDVDTQPPSARPAGHDLLSQQTPAQPAQPAQPSQPSDDEQMMDASAAEETQHTPHAVPAFQPGRDAVASAHGIWNFAGITLEGMSLSSLFDGAHEPVTLNCHMHKVAETFSVSVDPRMETEALRVVLVVAYCVARNEDSADDALRVLSRALLSMKDGDPSEAISIMRQMQERQSSQYAPCSD
tara:strand:- start:2717 stop:3703 length:987 start_codon:yes stop_codon:yes gene_type:complete